MPDVLRMIDEEIAKMFYTIGFLQLRSVTFSQTPAESCFAVSPEESAGRPRLHIAALAAGDIMRPIRPSSHWPDVASTNTRPALCGDDSHVLALFVCPGLLGGNFAAAVSQLAQTTEARL